MVPPPLPLARQPRGVPGQDEPDRLAAGADAERAVGRLQVDLHGARADPERLADLLVGGAVLDQLEQDVALAAGQPRLTGRRLR